MNKRKSPFFSIVTISFNQEDYIKDCIDSVLIQSFEDYEYIIQDPGSTDNSREIIKGYKSPKLRYFFEKDNSPAQGLNKGFSKATGKYYLFLNSDDVLLKDTLSIFYQTILKYPLYDVYSGGSEIINAKGEKLRETFSDKYDINMAVYGHSIIIQPSTTFKSSLFKSVGGFNEKNICNWDTELFFDFAMKSAKFFKIKNMLSQYRITNESLTGSGKYKDLYLENNKKMYKKLYLKDINISYYLLSIFYRIKRKILNLDDTINRILYGKISKRKF